MPTARIVQAPVVASSQTHRSVKDSDHVDRAEYSLKIRDSAAFHKTYIPLAAGQDLFFPTLTTIADQYQTYAFDKIGLLYTPNKGSTTAGRVALAPIATWTDYEKITSYDQVIALPNCIQSSIWSPFEARFPMSSFNTQFKEWRMAVGQQINYNESALVQGLIVVAIEQCDATDTMDVGKFLIDYGCRVAKPKMGELIPVQPGHWYNAVVAAGVSDTDDTCGYHNFGKFSVSTTDPATTTPDYVVTSNSRHDFMVMAVATDAAAGFTGITHTDTTNCISTVHAQAQSTTACVWVLYVHVITVGSPVVITLTPTLGAGTVDSVRVYAQECGVNGLGAL